MEKWGGEASASLLLTETLDIGLVVDDVHGTRLDHDRTPLPVIPPLRARVEISHDAGDWWMGGNVRGVRTQDRVAPEEQVTPGYALFNMEDGLRLDDPGRHLITLRIDNTLNTSYRDHLSRVDERDFPMPGRNIQLSYRWIF